MENGGNSYRIRSEERPCGGQSWVPELLGADLGWPGPCRVSLGSVFPWQSGGCWAAPRQQQFGQEGTGSPSFPQPAPCCGKGRFSPQNGSLVGQTTFAPSPWQKRNPIPVLRAPLGFLRAIPGAWLLRLQHFHCLSPSFFHSFPPLLPSLPCALAERPPHGLAATAAPRNGPRRRIIAIANLHSPSPSPPLLLPSPNRSCTGARSRTGWPATLEWPAPGEPPSRGWRE